MLGGDFFVDLARDIGIIITPMLGERLWLVCCVLWCVRAVSTFLVSVVISSRLLQSTFGWKKVQENLHMVAVPQVDKDRGTAAALEPSQLYHPLYPPCRGATR